MAEAEVGDIAQSEEGRAGGIGRFRVKLGAAGVIVVCALGAAGPSWAGPLMGC